MTRHLLIVLMNAKPGREDELNAWYDEHILEAVQLDGWVSAQRYRLADGQADGPFQYLAVYEIDDLETAQRALLAAREARDAEGNVPTAFLHTSDAKQPDKRMMWWTAITERRTS